MNKSKTIKNQSARIMDRIYTDRAISRIDIARSLSITPATVSEITHGLIEQGLIFEIGEVENTELKAGRKKVLLSVAEKHSYFLGVELFEHAITLSLCDNCAHILKEERIPVANEANLSQDFFVKTVEMFIKENEAIRISGIGIAIPGHYNQVDPIILTNNSFWHAFNLDTISEQFAVPVYFENNVNCMALYERYFGQLQKDPNFIFLHFRRGMFCTYMYDSAIYARQNYSVGEIGHTVINPEGETCECGKKGCLQTYASQTWLIKKAKMIYVSEPKTKLRALVSNHEKLSMDHIMEAYRLEDRAVQEILHRAIDYVAIAINNLVVTLDTEMIFFHAHLFDEPHLAQYLLKRLDVNKSRVLTHDEQVKIIKPYSRMSGARGACALAISETYAKIEL